MSEEPVSEKMSFFFRPNFVREVLTYENGVHVDSSEKMKKWRVRT